MELAEAREIIECLPSGRTPFPYYKDRYALLLLNLIIGSGCSKRDIEGTPFARLLNKSVVRNVLAASGDGTLCPLALEANWPQRYETYLLTLGTWDPCSRRWGQTSRPGARTSTTAACPAATRTSGATVGCTTWRRLRRWITRSGA
ncbi:MAG: hypothetical protein AAFU65_13530 [Pseudomonadota bacterium]